MLNKKTPTPSEHKYPINSTTLLVFVDAGENFVMADDVITPSNPLISLVEKEEFEEASLDMNVSQRSHKKKLFRRVVHIRIDRLAWDR